MNFSNDDKQALINGTATIPFRINIINNGSVVDTLDENSIVNIDYEDFRYVDGDSLMIGQFVSRKVTGTLDRIYTDFEIEDMELELELGVSYNNNTTYYSLGNFLVVKPSNDEVKDKTTFEAMDYTKKFNKIFDDTQLTFPCTALQLATECCRQVGVTLSTVNFANYDFQIPTNQYTEGETCRKVMQDIGKLAYSWVRIGTDNNCYIDFEINNSVDTYNTITSDNYYDLSIQNDSFGPVNRVVIGMRDVEGENVVIEDSESVAQYGATEIKLYDSNITYTPELRQQAINAATRLFGLTYTPVQISTTGHPWLIGNEKIEIIDTNNSSIYTYPWDRTITYNGHIKSNIKSKADTKIETEYKNYGTLENEMRKTRITVDKQNQEIEAISQLVQPISKTITGIGSVQLENAYVGTLHRLTISGDISILLVPRDDLYPSNTLYPQGSFYLIIDNNEYKYLDFSYLGYINSTYHDVFVYEEGSAWIERNTYYDGNGDLQPLIPMQKEDLEGFLINVNSNSILEMENCNNATITVEYLLDNEYTDTFAPTVDIVSKINLSPGIAQIEATKLAQITAEKISLEGYTTINGAFSVDLDGNMTATNATLNGSFKNYSNGNLAIEIKGTDINVYDWRGSGSISGSVSSVATSTVTKKNYTTGGSMTTSTEAYSKGVSLYTYEGNTVSLGYKNNEASTEVHNIISFDTSNPTDTPYIINTANGNLFKYNIDGYNYEGITVQNGLIKSWGRTGYTGYIGKNVPRALHIANGLIIGIDT